MQGKHLESVPLLQEPQPAFANSNCADDLSIRPIACLSSRVWLAAVRIENSTALNHAMTAQSLILRAVLSRYKLQCHYRTHFTWTAPDERHPAIRQRLLWLAGVLVEEIS
jgi:hypothetical protein